MGKLQGYIPLLESTTLRFYLDKGEGMVELAWHNDHFDIYYNGKFLKTLNPDDRYLFGDLFPYNPGLTYKENSLVTYVNESSPIEQFRNKAIYRSDSYIQLNQDPENFSDLWIYQGSYTTRLTIGDIQDLEFVLSTKLSKDMFSEEFQFNETEQKMYLNLDYITINDYLGDRYQALPDSLEYTLVSGNTYIALDYEDWDDGLGGIYSYDGDSNNDAIYGKYYTADALSRLLAAKPDHRLPTYAESKFIESEGLLTTSTMSTSVDFRDLINDQTTWQTIQGTPYTPFWSPGSNVYLNPGGYVTITKGVVEYKNKYKSTHIWTSRGLLDYSNYGLFSVYSPYNSTVLDSDDYDLYLVSYPPIIENNDNRVAYPVRLIKYK